MKLKLLHLKLIAFFSLTLFTLSISGLISNNKLNFIFMAIGYMCMPLFAYIISEGYRNTRNINKYLLRILLIAILSALPHRYVCISAASAWDPRLFFSSALTGLFCLLSIIVYDKIKYKYAKIFCVVFTVVISFVLGMELAPHALIIMYIIHFCRDKKFIELAYYISSYSIVITIVSLFMLFSNADLSIKSELYRNIAMIGCILSLFFIKKYDGTKGPSCKLLSYSYYLVLLAIIVSIKVI